MVLRMLHLHPAHLVFYFYFAVFRSPQITFSIKRQTKAKELIITTNNELLLQFAGIRDLWKLTQAT